MAKITYEALQKPLEQRLEDAACIYFEVERSFFTLKGKGKETEKRYTLYHILKEDCSMSTNELAERYECGWTTMNEALGVISFRIKNCREIAVNAQKIRQIAANLDAKLVVMEVRLEQFFNDNEVAPEAAG